MSSALELFGSRVGHIALAQGRATVFFSVAYFYRSKGTPGKDPGSGWTQEAELVIDDATLSGALPSLPNTITEGVLEVGGIKHDLIPVPFRRKVPAVLSLKFEDGSAIEISGTRPFLELLGQPIPLEDFS